VIFVDTSAFYALEVEDDINHLKALNFVRKELSTGKHGLLITSEYVLDECLTLLRMRYGIESALEFYDKIRRSKSLRIIWVNEELFNETFKFFKKNRKFKWSFTDCVSFTIMDKLGIVKAFTFDENFVKAGFIKLP